MSPSRSRRRRSPKKKSNNKKWILISVLVIVVLIAGFFLLVSNNPSEDLPTNNKIRLQTSMGEIIIELRDDMPITTTNFKKLVQQGVYDGTIFHRVIAGFMIQGGNPDTGPWSGGSIQNIEDEISDNAENRKNVRGTISMAKQSGPDGMVIPDSANSQFFINVVDNSGQQFDDTYPVFGEVIEGIIVADDISNMQTSGSPLDQPIEDVVLIKATFVD